MSFFFRKLFYFLFLYPTLLFSQQNDSLKYSSKKSTLSYFNYNQFESGDSSNYIQPTLYNFSSYLGRNNLGNNGLVFSELLYSPSIINYIGFNYSKNSYLNYFLTPQNLKYYNTRTPYTDLFYVTGSKKEQLFKLIFTYNVKKNWNITADFSRIRSEGFYLRQNTNHNFLALSSNYKSLNNRYYLLASIIYNNAKNSENGGILNDSSLLNSENLDKKLIGVNLSNAKRTTINRSLYLKQYFNLGNKSQDTSKIKTITPKSRVILTSHYEDNILKYEDETPWSGYYTNIYYDSTRTFDSTYHRKLENEVEWKRVDNKKHRGFIDILGLGVNLKHQAIKVEQRELFKISDVSVTQGLVNTTQSAIDTSLNNIIAGTSLFNTYSNNNFWWILTGKYAVNGYNKGDHYSSLSIKKVFNDSLTLLLLKAENKLQTSDFIYRQYLSNHFRWKNDFDKMSEQKVQLYFIQNRYDLTLSASYQNFKNVLYFNDSALAQQDTNSISLLSFALKKDFVFHNWHLNNSILYQNVTDSAVIRIPEFILQHSLYYENYLFKRAMRLQVGISLFYFSAYYANAYMPATAQFYLQNDKKYGNYPFLDFFIAAKIKTVRIFFKIDHLNSDLMGGNYMFVPHYPVNGRAFKFGVSWLFYD
jgi:hypothetical protein